MLDGDLLEPRGEITGMLTVVIECGDDEVVTTRGPAVEEVAHSVSDVDPQLCRDVGIADPVVRVGGVAAP